MEQVEDFEEYSGDAAESKNEPFTYSFPAPENLMVAEEVQYGNITK